MFCVAKTVLRALGLGVSGDELEKVVRSGGEKEPGTGHIVEEVSTVLHGALHKYPFIPIHLLWVIWNILFTCIC